MGLAHRDYMRSHRQDDHFNRRSAPTGPSKLAIVLFWLVIGIASGPRPAAAQAEQPLAPPESPQVQKKQLCDY
ncbi:MAG: hypothetical protein EOO54_17625, partial [Haliea sp.]